MKHRHPILSSTASLLLLVQLVVFGALPCRAGACARSTPMEGSQILPACCCGPSCSGEWTTTDPVEAITPPAEGSVESLQLWTTQIATASPVTDAYKTGNADVAVRFAHAPPLFLLHASLLI